MPDKGIKQHKEITMKLNPEFVIQAVADSTMLVPVGDAATKFHGVLQLNRTAAFIVECLKDDTTEDRIKETLNQRYEGTDEAFMQSIRGTVSKLRERGALIE